VKAGKPKTRGGKWKMPHYAIVGKRGKGCGDVDGNGGG